MTQLLARDLDNDPLVFGVVGEEASRFFAVESVTGVVWLRQPLDREVTLPSAGGGEKSPCWDKWRLFTFCGSWGVGNPGVRRVLLTLSLWGQRGKQAGCSGSIWLVVFHGSQNNICKFRSEENNKWK